MNTVSIPSSPVQSLEYRLTTSANTIAPGFVDTPQLRSAGQETVDANTAATPLGRIGTPEDIGRSLSLRSSIMGNTDVGLGWLGELAAFLLSDKAGYITGATHLIDGGWMNAGPGPLNRHDSPDAR